MALILLAVSSRTYSFSLRWTAAPRRTTAQLGHSRRIATTPLSSRRHLLWEDILVQQCKSMQYLKVFNPGFTLPLNELCKAQALVVVWGTKPLYIYTSPVITTVVRGWYKLFFPYTSTSACGVRCTRVTGYHEISFWWVFWFAISTLSAIACHAHITQVFFFRTGFLPFSIQSYSIDNLVHLNVDTLYNPFFQAVGTNQSPKMQGCGRCTSNSKVQIYCKMA